jgi:DNA-binding MarR family transcriptional regulator
MASSTTKSKADAAHLDEIELAAWRGFLRVHAKLMKELDAELQEAHGLPLTWFDVLIQLEFAPDRQLRMSELADSVLLSRSGLTRLVDRLERDGLVERCRFDGDARGLLARLTDAGRRRVLKARDTHLADVRERFLNRFSRAELERLGAMWEKVLEPKDP